jgi:hypothetical protein
MTVRQVAIGGPEVVLLLQRADSRRAKLQKPRRSGVNYHIGLFKRDSMYVSEVFMPGPPQDVANWRAQRGRVGATRSWE